MNEARETIRGLFLRAAEAKLNEAPKEVVFKEVLSISNGEAEYLLREAQFPTIFWGVLTWLFMFSQMGRMGKAGKLDKKGMGAMMPNPSQLLYTFVKLNVSLVMYKMHREGLDKAAAMAFVQSHDPFKIDDKLSFVDNQLFN